MYSFFSNRKDLCAMLLKTDEMLNIIRTEWCIETALLLKKKIGNIIEYTLENRYLINIQSLALHNTTHRLSMIFCRRSQLGCILHFFFEIEFLCVIFWEFSLHFLFASCKNHFNSFQKYMTLTLM